MNRDVEDHTMIKLNRRLSGLVQSYRTRPRCGDYVVGQIYAVGGLTKNGESVSTVEIYDPVTKEWRMGEAMSMLR